MKSVPVDMPDVWAPVGTDDLPSSLVAAFRESRWDQLRRELGGIMDGAITDGPYGRALLQLVLALPAGIDPVFDRYKFGAMLDHGDWDGIRNGLPYLVAEPIEIRGVRDILTAPVDRATLPEGATEFYQKALFEIYEYQARRAVGPMRRWAHRIAGVLPDALWRRDDVAIGRHTRFRQLHDITVLAIAESQGGRLEVAYALASESVRLGDAAEPFRFVAHDLINLVRLGMGDQTSFELQIPSRICAPTGPSPVGTWEMIFYVIPFLALRTDGSLAWTSRLAGEIASRLGSPRWQLQADSWRVASDLVAGSVANRTELAGIVARSRRASPGLKSLPSFLLGYAYRRRDSFVEAERFARLSGNVWLQVSSLTWITALDPTPRVAHRLRQLLDITGWRRPVLVPTEIAADAALGMASLGERSESILELALVADRPNVTTALVAKYVDDVAAPMQTRLAAVDALNRIGTTHAREILGRYAQRHDEIGKAAARKAARPAFGLSEREIEVLGHAGDGLTNREIADKLFLSPHTVARHLANARAKLGAANRAEAAVRLHRVAD